MATRKAPTKAEALAALKKKRTPYNPNAPLPNVAALPRTPYGGKPDEGTRGPSPAPTTTGTGTGGSFTYTPPPKKTSLNAGAAFNQFILKHKRLKPYADLLWKWSKVYGIDAVELAALVQFESGGRADARSKANALGLAQIHMPTWAGKEAWKGSGPVTEAAAKNPAFAVRFAAWYFSQKKAQYGSFDEAYRKGYNPGYTGPGPSSLLPKGYVPRTGSLSPQEEASVAVETADEKAALTNAWAVRTKDGVKFVTAADPPKNTIRSFGQPVDQSGFLRAKQHYNDTYQAYVGKDAPDAAIAHILNTGLSDYALANRLSQSPNFKNGTVYKARAGGIVQYAKGLYGDNWKPDPDLVRKAIVQNWDEGTLVAKLRARPEYLKGPQFKKDEAGKLFLHQSIMGQPDEAARTLIKEATLGGWSDDQYAAFLRGSDAYKYSPEFQTKALTFAKAMGLFTGAVPTLVDGTTTANTAPQISGPPPDSKRIPGKPGLNAPSGRVVGGGYGG